MFIIAIVALIIVLLSALYFTALSTKLITDFGLVPDKKLYTFLLMVSSVVAIIIAVVVAAFYSPDLRD